ncbi:hypothetical protein RB195_016052 [Necator americanus]|uniref:Uncharacterized protein n=1 Tax=Necator americanus TaxID=51031 RepID=A0ABR1E7I2_NECAM
MSNCKLGPEWKTPISLSKRLKVSEKKSIFDLRLAMQQRVVGRGVAGVVLLAYEVEEKSLSDQGHEYEIASFDYEETCALPGKGEKFRMSRNNKEIIRD